VNRLRRAFSLTELLVVIAIVSVLIALLVVAIQKVQATSRSVGCQSNQRQIALACVAYATDHSGRLVSPRTDKPDTGAAGSGFDPGGGCPRLYWPTAAGGIANGPESYHCWVMMVPGGVVNEPGAVYYNGGPSGDTRQETEYAITRGRLWPYLGVLSAYRSPLDKQDRLRSYSLNAFVGVQVPDDWIASSPVAQWQADLGEGDCGSFNTTAMARVQKPAMTLCSIVESKQQGLYSNFGGWIIDPTQARWYDWPALWDGLIVTHSNVDGSSTAYEMQDAALAETMRTIPPNTDLTEPGGVHAVGLYFRNRLLPGNIANAIPGAP
jgi:prepilin-type N-terminal cleavage/methylation domain-containing protein